MKKTIIILLPLLCLLACERVQEEGPARFEMDTESILVGCEGGVETITVSSPEEWTAFSPEPWVMVSPANGIGSTKVRVSVDTTLIHDVRTARISFSVAGRVQAQLPVSQTGYGNVISVEKPSVEIEYFKEYSQRNFSVKVISNTAFRAVPDEDAPWLKVGDVPEFTPDAGSRPRASEIRFSWTLNSDSEERVAHIRFVPEDESLQTENPAVLTVTQKAAPLIEDSRRGDSLTVVLINNMLDAMTRDDPAENMHTWNNVALWDAVDKDLPCPEAVGRIRAVRFYMFTTEDPIPEIIGNLKYLQTLDFYSNINNERKSIELGTAICSLEHLKYLEVGAYGLISIPDELANLGSHLVALNLNSNCFNEIPAILTPENFPALKSLNLATNRRISWLTDLREMPQYDYRGGAGMHVDCFSDDSALRRLLRWENLEELILSYNCFEGHIPDFTVGEDGVEAWSEDDIRESGDTLRFLVDNRIPKILPNARQISLNLNFFTGDLPDWLLYHPRLMEMAPDILIFNQQERGRDSRGSLVRFDNEPQNFDYWFDAFPLLTDKYTYDDEYED